MIQLLFNIQVDHHYLLVPLVKLEPLEQHHFHNQIKLQLEQITTVLLDHLLLVVVNHFLQLQDQLLTIKRGGSEHAKCLVRGLTEGDPEKVQMARQLWTCCEMETDLVSPAQHKDKEKKDPALAHPQALKMDEVLLEAVAVCLEVEVIEVEECPTKTSVEVLQVFVVVSSREGLMQTRKNH
jgi:hypothetical protein